MSKADKAERQTPVEDLPARKKQGEVIPAVGFTKLEKNLASLGFFTASSKVVRGAKEKRITLVKRTAGSNKTVEASATILPSHKYGLPITSDQDKYLALLKIVADIRREKGAVQNPIAFTSAEILRLLNKRVSAGKNYDDIENWLSRMTLTGISSRGVVFLAGRKRWASDTFHVFERAVSLGKELPDGSVADKNYVWLSEWQLENINNNFLLPIDLDTYTRVRNHIAKTLIPLLQIWLYASRQDGCFEKRYTELCEILNIRRYQHLSKIREKLGPSLDELVDFGYLSSWKVEKTANRKDFKVRFFHGSKFLADLDRALPSGQSVDFTEDLPSPADEDIEPAPRREELVDELTERGVGRRAAMSLAKKLPHGDEALRVIEWADQEIARKNPANPAGFLVHLIRENVSPPESFLSSRQVESLERAEEAKRLEEQKQARLYADYERHKGAEVDKALRAFSAPEYEQRIEQKKEELLTKFPVFSSSPAETLQQSAERALRSEIESSLPIPTFEQYCQSPHRDSE